jgi:phage tail tape-measure protein
MTIDDSGQNVTNGMKSIGHAWATATTPAAVHMDGTMDSLRVVPCIGSMMTTEGGAATGATYEPEDEAFFTNPLGVYNKYYGTWIQPENRFWNGKFWAPTKKAREKRAAAREQQVAARRHLPKPERRVAKTLVAAADEDSDETESEESEEEEPPLKRSKRKGKAPVRQAKAMKMEDPPAPAEDVSPPQYPRPYGQPRWRLWPLRERVPTR